jgi:hypothetical protein
MIYHRKFWLTLAAVSGLLGVLKLAGVVSWSWWLVLAPLLVPMGAVVALVTGVLIWAIAKGESK